MGVSTCSRCAPTLRRVAALCSTGRGVGSARCTGPTSRSWTVPDTTPGLINTDFADVKMIMSNAGTAIMGIGAASGEGRAVNAARAALDSPLLEASIEGARGILLNIAGGNDLGLFDVNEAASIIQEVAHPDVNLIFGNVIDDTMGDEVRITVIAAGFERWDDKRGGGERRRASLGLGEDGGDDDEFMDLEDDEFDVPSFLK